MANEGIVRRIDELGRVVIPKELRRTMQIRDGEELEIIPGSNGSITIRKFSTLGQQFRLAEVCAKALCRAVGKEIIVTTKTDAILAYGGQKPMNNAPLSYSVIREMEQRQSRQMSGIALIKGDYECRGDYYIIPIISGGDLYGSIIINGNVNGNEILIGGAVANCLIGLLE